MAHHKKEYTCPYCRQPIRATSRYCSQCGKPLPRDDISQDIVVPQQSNTSLYETDTSINLSELLTLVQSGISLWQQRMQSTSGMAREQAAAAIRDLSLILGELSTRLQQGHNTIRITAPLPTPREYQVGCPLCGRGNRSGARFCLWCGSLLSTAARHETAPLSPTFSVRSAQKSDIGKVRTNNEDICYTGTVSPKEGSSVLVFVVADGMGGEQAGEEASSLAVESMKEELVSELHKVRPKTADAWQAILQQVVGAANQRVYADSRADQAKRGMGTTFTMILIADDAAHLAHVGDSRAYLLNARGATKSGAPLIQLSTDHTLAARLIEIGRMKPEDVRKMPQRNMLYRALGVEAQVEVETQSQPLEDGDIFLLCSDGLTRYVDGEELVNVVLAATTPDQACERLVSLANERGGRDNCSIVIAKIESQGSSSSSSSSSS